MPMKYPNSSKKLLVSLAAFLIIFGLYSRMSSSNDVQENKRIAGSLTGWKHLLSSRDEVKKNQPAGVEENAF